MSSILICNESISSGGLGTYTFTIAKHFKNRNWNVYFLVTNHIGEYYSDIKSISDNCLNLTTHHLNFKKVKIAADFVNDINPSVLLLNHCSLLHYALPFISFHIKPVAVLHNDIEPIYRVAALFSARIFRWIAPSNTLSYNFKSFTSNCCHQRIRIIQHGIDTSCFSSNIKFSEKKNNKIVFIGNIGENKGADYLPKILELVKTSFSHIDVQIVGHGNLRPIIEQNFLERGISVTFTGYLDSVKVAQILRESVILLLPSRVEGFGLVIIEAMMSGAVPVASRLRGVTDDIINDGVTGILVTPGDVNGFAEAIVHLLKDPERLRSMSETAMAVATERYSASRMLDAYEALFAEADDRGLMKHPGTFGWIGETIGEVVKKGVDRKWLFNRAMEIWK